MRTHSHTGRWRWLTQTVTTFNRFEMPSFNSSIMALPANLIKYKGPQQSCSCIVAPQGA
jgi:hypothetical protein